MVDNTTRFKAAFNELHNAVAEKVGYSKDTNFGFLLDKADKNNDKVIKSYKEPLEVLRNFRNLLTHNSLNGENIATPSEALIDEVEHITQKIAHPGKVIDLFNREVISFDVDDSLKDVLKAVDLNGYSQFPVFNGDKLQGIISENGITNFLAKAVDDDVISISETTVANVIEKDEEKDSFEVIKENKSIYDIENIFSKRIAEGKTAFVLLITSDGHVKRDQGFKGIITPWDLPTVEANK